MAPRKPKNPVNDIINATSAWLGGNRGTVPSQVTRGMDVVRGIGGTLDSATGGFGRAVVSDARSGSNTPSALYKTTAVNLAAAATGVGAAKVAGKVAGKVLDSGVVGQAVNKVRGEVVGLHGSPVAGLKYIEPRIPIQGPNKGKGAKTYLFRTDQSPDRIRFQNTWKQNSDLDETIKLSRKYATGEMGWSKPKTAPGQGSVYVVRTPRDTTDLSQDALTRGILATSSTSKAKVVSEIPLLNKSSEQIALEVTQKLKRAGVKVPKKK
jgi:hypothetical protein